MAEDRFALLHQNRHLLPGAVGCAALLCALAATPVVQLGAAACGVVLFALIPLLRARRPVLIVDDHGHRVEVAGQRRFAVAWTEVREVRVDREERALYVDCGDRARNLLLPPTRGYPFTFADRDRLFQRVLEAVPSDRQREVPSLEAAAASS